MQGLLLLFGSLLAFGTYNIAADRLGLSRLTTARTLHAALRQSQPKGATLEQFWMRWAIRLGKHLPMDRYRRIRLQKTLSAAGVDLSPETYTAYAIVKAGTILILAIPCLPLLPLLVPVIVLLAILVYFKERKRADELLAKRRDEIESDLPRMVSTLTQELKASRDVLTMLERYKESAGPVLHRELDVVIADMRSSSYEAALTRFESRFNSPMLSDVVRGLIGVLRGDDSIMYFQMLSHDMKQLELQRLKAKAQKVPPNIRIFSFLLLGCFLLTYIVVIALQIIGSVGVFM